ncbi:glutathione S-transferase [Pandoraea sp.]|uniref:glutathione S-transferase family protein n=1 Tax=Pandoraea sp. TaxID=1883445 RepID=UPI00121494D4|nr:glutathione S-transferase [Pandoraea sp.]TAL55192.1 MAG: glutathione S-transferase family protein [Pandoraea sp.]TAM18842.1 MAG: glutathione S-transferase family protein [Pandoraea sp.]
MLKLCGFALSNYYNKVKMVLLEKGVPFEESFAYPSQDEAFLARSPLGKVPFFETAHGTLCESQPMIEYLEALHPEPPMYSRDAFAAGKQRELIVFLELHLELVARELYPQAFFGGTLSESAQARVHKRLERHISAFRQVARFDPYLAGEEFSAADCAAFVHLPVIGLATQQIYGSDMLIDHGIDWKGYVKLIGERPSAQRVTADRKAYLAQHAKH